MANCLHICYKFLPCRYLKHRIIPNENVDATEVIPLISNQPVAGCRAVKRHLLDFDDQQNVILVIMH